MNATKIERRTRDALERVTLDELGQLLGHVNAHYCVRTVQSPGASRSSTPTPAFSSLFAEWKLCFDVAVIFVQ